MQYSMERSRDTPPFGYTVTGDDVIVVQVRGDVDMVTAPELGDTIDGIVAAGKRDVEADLSGVDFLDSSGLQALWRAHRRLQEVGGNLSFTAVSRPVANVFKRSGLEGLLAGPNSKD